MSGRLTRSAYEQLVAEDEDIAWLETMPRTPEFCELERVS